MRVMEKITKKEIFDPKLWYRLSIFQFGKWLDGVPIKYKGSVYLDTGEGTFELTEGKEIRTDNKIVKKYTKK